MLKSSDKGFTLIEVIIVIIILSIVAAITLSFMVDSMRIYTLTVNQKTLWTEGNWRWRECVGISGTPEASVHQPLEVRVI